MFSLRMHRCNPQNVPRAPLNYVCVDASLPVLLWLVSTHGGGVCKSVTGCSAALPSAPKHHVSTWVACIVPPWTFNRQRLCLACSATAHVMQWSPRPPSAGLYACIEQPFCLTSNVNNVRTHLAPGPLFTASLPPFSDSRLG